MIRQSTVFILGAGASVPYGFPSGMKLLRDAKNSPHHHIANVVGDHVGVAQVAALHEALRDCQNESLDGLLEYRDDLSLAGRLLIAREILLAEAGSHLEDRWPQPFDDWLAYLYSRMLEDVQRPDYFWQENAVTFVTFNYDRMLEYKIARALRAQFRLDDVQYAEVLRSARIIHLHGSLGRLEHGEQFVPFGCNAPDPSQMNNHLPEWHLRAAESIKIVHQARADTPEFVDARKALHRAERVVFLGFGFGSKNVERLQFSSIKENASIFLTRLGMTEAEYIRRVRTPMKNAKVREHQLASPPNFGCADLLRANVGALF